MSDDDDPDGRPPFRVALAGYGLAGSVFHAPLITHTPGLELAAIVTGNVDRRAAARRDHPDILLLERVEQLWERAEELDVLVVATANRSHATLAERAMREGLDVVVEKPPATTARDAHHLADVAEELGALLTVFHNRRGDGDFLTLRRLLAGRTLGDVTRFESRFERWRPVPRAGDWRLRHDPAEGGGLLLDLGSHLVDQAVELFGPPVRVYAEMESRREGVDVDDDTFVALEHAGGVRSHLWMSAVSAINGPRFRLLGTRGAYVKEGLDGQEDALRHGMRPGDPAWGVEPQELWGRLAIGEEVGPLETERGAWPAFYEQLVAALRGDEPPPVDPYDAARVVEILEAARESAVTHTVVDFVSGSG